MTEVRDKAGGEDHQGRMQKRRRVNNQPPGSKTNSSLEKGDTTSATTSIRQISSKENQPAASVRSKEKSSSHETSQPAGRFQSEAGYLRQWLTEGRKCSSRRKEKE